MGPGNASSDLVVKGSDVCTVGTGLHLFRNINVYGGGQLVFDDGKGTPTDLWAANIIVENGGVVRAGTMAQNGTVTPIAGPVTIHLYGADQGPGGIGATCASDAHCGIPDNIWGTNSTDKKFPDRCAEKKFSNGVTDCFYNYDALTFDNGNPKAANGQKFGYFGYKVLAVGYGGTLQLFGKKGATYDNASGVVPSNTGTSWARLNNCPNKKNDGIAFCNRGTLQPKAKSIILSKKVDWQKGDKLVVSPTDYLPDHGELVEILTAGNCANGLCDTFTFKNLDPAITKPDGSCPNGVQANSCAFKYPHMASQYSLNKVTGGQKPTGWTDVDTRAAVGLLSRSIRIVSEGDTATAPFPPEPTRLDGPPGYYFGGHVVIRQGFQKVQVQGVEFYQLGQGGKIGHYPIHFHMNRKVPNKTNAAGCNNCETWVKDCSIWDSMTRWIAVHATQGLLLARNVGYKSIGHGYYLEDGTETDNKLYANLGVFARAAIVSAQNMRQVPGILAAPDYPFRPSPPFPPNIPSPPDVDVVPFHSDWDHPSTFWIMNAWNDFEYNMAAGTGTCGVCYWLLPGINSGMSRFMHWDSYASEQQLPDEKTSGGTTPLQAFTGNTCVSSMASFLTIANATACNGVQIGENQLDKNFPVLNPAAPAGANKNTIPSANARQPDKNGLNADNYYPHIGGGGRFPTKCAGSGDCSKQNTCDDRNEANCVVTTLDHYTSSFTWAETNFASIWLRPQWYLVINSAITDAQNGGLTMVTGGGYTRSDAAHGHWDLVKKTAFIGNTQNSAANPFASNAGPFNPGTGLGCDHKPNYGWPGNYCLDAADGVSFAKSNFALNQRMFSIYDGPAYEDSNAYLDVTRTSLPSTNDVDGCTHNTTDPSHNCANSKYAQAGQTLAMPFDANNNECYLPNAAIAWKQPNGFFYPPAFHSRNLLFDNVDIRHFVIEPLFDLSSPDLFRTSLADVKKRYCTYNETMFSGYTDVDRQTELNDDDGTLTGLTGPFAKTGLVGSISVNQDDFFKAPVRTAECLSDVDVTPSNVKNNPAAYPGTAVTSPYDYVTTVVFPECAANGDQCPNDINRKEPGGSTHKGPYWDKECSTPTCYGVPLYREDILNGETGAVPIRLMGQSIYQRSGLTANNGRYYIDTTASQDVEDKPVGKDPKFPNPSLQINLFRPGKKYFVFLLFAKNTTKQTYDLYVGKNFQPDNADQLWLTQVQLPSSYKFEKIGKFPQDDVSYNADTGVLTVTLDMSHVRDKKGRNFQTLSDAAEKDNCQPATFCKWVDNPGDGKDHCQCANSIFSPPSSTFQASECGDTNGICSWATADVDCPDGGCFGFGFKVSDKFVASNSPPDPAPKTQPFDSASNSPWNAPFVCVNTGGDCNYPSCPAESFSLEDSEEK